MPYTVARSGAKRKGTFVMAKDGSTQALSFSGHPILPHSTETKCIETDLSSELLSQFKAFEPPLNESLPESLSLDASIGHTETNRKNRGQQKYGVLSRFGSAPKSSAKGPVGPKRKGTFVLAKDGAIKALEIQKLPYDVSMLPSSKKKLSQTVEENLNRPSIYKALESHQLKENQKNKSAKSAFNIGNRGVKAKRKGTFVMGASGSTHAIDFGNKLKGGSALPPNILADTRVFEEVQTESEENEIASNEEHLNVVALEDARRISLNEDLSVLGASEDEDVNGKEEADIYKADLINESGNGAMRAKRKGTFVMSSSGSTKSLEFSGNQVELSKASRKLSQDEEDEEESAMAQQRILQNLAPLKQISPQSKETFQRKRKGTFVLGAGGVSKALDFGSQSQKIGDTQRKLSEMAEEQDILRDEIGNKSTAPSKSMKRSVPNALASNSHKRKGTFIMGKSGATETLALTSTDPSLLTNTHRLSSIGGDEDEEALNHDNVDESQSIVSVRRSSFHNRKGTFMMGEGGSTETLVFSKVDSGFLGNLHQLGSIQCTDDQLPTEEESDLNQPSNIVTEEEPEISSFNASRRNSHKRNGTFIQGANGATQALTFSTVNTAILSSSHSLSTMVDDMTEESQLDDNGIVEDQFDEVNDTEQVQQQYKNSISKPARAKKQNNDRIRLMSLGDFSVDKDIVEAASALEQDEDVICQSFDAMNLVRDNESDTKLLEDGAKEKDSNNDTIYNEQTKIESDICSTNVNHLKSSSKKKNKQKAHRRKQMKNNSSAKQDMQLTPRSRAIFKIELEIDARRIKAPKTRRRRIVISRKPRLDVSILASLFRDECNNALNSEKTFAVVGNNAFGSNCRQ